MKKIEILPAIDLLDGQCVRLAQGDYNRKTVYSDSPAEQATLWEKEGAKFIHLVDLDGAKAGKPINLAAVKAITSTVSIPCELGGGIRNIKDAETLFNAGITRIILGTVACSNPKIVTDMIKNFGTDRIVIGIDAKEGRVAVSGWLEDTNIDAFDLAAQFAETGIKRFIYTDISTDGMLTGPNLQAQKKLCQRVPECAVIASGGISCTEDIANLADLHMKNLEGVIVGKALYDGRISLKELLDTADNTGY